MMRKTWMLLFMPALALAQPRPQHNLQFDSLAVRWDEAMPLGNGLVGALVWKKEGRLRLSIDRVDLWDDRPMPGMDRLTFKWVTEQVKKREYDTVQKAGDAPYERNAAPTKIPGAALEFDIRGLGKAISNHLDIATGLNEVRFSNGAVFKTYVHARLPYGLFTIENAPATLVPQLKVPAYNSVATSGGANSVEGQSLQRLGYAAGTVTETSNRIRYRQPTYDGHYYEVLVTWQRGADNVLSGSWTITNDAPAETRGFSGRARRHAWKTHLSWWNGFWSRSSLSLPDSALEKQYYRDMYKFASVARANTPPISLQAVWTADNGKLPPWKGDFHHDLNTQLSYWPGYTANHLDLTEGFTSWLWQTKDENKRWTKQYFGTQGLNVPGVTTISGKPMGGWIQYSLSPTTAAWLAQHFYWQWKYSGDERFLKERCKPWFDEVLQYFNGIRITDGAGKYALPLSSSPEHNDNSIRAWYTGYSNYDLSLIRFFYEKYAEVAKAATGVTPKSVLDDLARYPYFNTDSTGLTIAPEHPLASSHRHHSHLIGIYPLKTINYRRPDEKVIIDQSLAWLHKKGTRAWVGYSFPWAACLYAQTGNGDSAVAMLQKFASNFVSVNTFHLNGDQKGGQYTDGTYRPFTLEGNFAFAQAVHELLLQTHDGVVELFPALPSGWKNTSFSRLRSEAGYLVSASLTEGRLEEVRILSEKGGPVRLRWAGTQVRFGGKVRPYTLNNGILEMAAPAGREVIIFAE